MVKKVLWPLVCLLCATAWGAEVVDITVELTVPDAAWTIAIDEVHKVGDELWVVSTVSRDPEIMGAQVISTVRASLKLDAPDLPVKHFVMGKSWNWQNQEPYVFIRQAVQIQGDLQSGELLYRRRRNE